MRKLLRQINRELKTAKHCAIYEEELNRVWPNDGNDGLCAIFDREPGERAEESHQTLSEA
jgi:hypothetical protein